MNNIVLVGRLTSDPEIKDLDDGKKVTNVTLWDGIAATTMDYCKKGDVIGVKGRLQSSSFENKDGEKEFRTNVIAERVTFLSSKTKDVPDNER